MLTTIIPASNRPSIAKTLDSVKKIPNVIVIGDGPCPITKQICKQYTNVSYYEIHMCNDFGASQRNFGMRIVKTPFITFLDDDDVYVSNGPDKILSYAKLDALNIFKVRLPDNRVVWNTQELEYGNLTTSGLVVPNTPEKLGVWTARYGTDFDFASMTADMLGRVNYIDFILTESRIC
jgi:glycosyltransferase involved in cell wall biosynthesis